MSSRRLYSYYPPDTSKYQYILPKPSRSNDKRKVLIDIRNILSRAEQLGGRVLKEAIPNRSEQEKKHENATKEMPSSCSSQHQDTKDANNLKSFNLLKEEDRGFLLFIITHGKQLANKLPNLTEPDALKTFQMLWSKMTPEHRSWYYNNENIIQTASIHQHIQLQEPSIGRELTPQTESFHCIRDVQRQVTPLFKWQRPDRFKEPKSYQITRPFKTNLTTTNLNKNRIISVPSPQPWHENEVPARSTSDSSTTAYFEECSKAVNSITADSDDAIGSWQHTYDWGESPNDHAGENITQASTEVPSKRIKTEDNRFDIGDIVKVEREYTSLMEHNDGHTAAAEALADKNPDFYKLNSVHVDEKRPVFNAPMKALDEFTEPSINFPVIRTEMDHNDNNVHPFTTTNDAADHVADGCLDEDVVDQCPEEEEEDIEYVMIPCDVKIAEMLGWPVHLLPRLSKADIEGYKGTILQ